MTRRLTLRLANLWRENPAVERDLYKLLGDRHAHLVGFNEAANFADELRAAAAACGYRVVGTDGEHLQRQNPIAVRDDVRLLGQGVRQMCDQVGRSPARQATFVLYLYAGRKRCHINTHANSHVQEGDGPHELPRVAQYVEHMRNLSDLIREGRRHGWTVTVSGDLNWSWSARVLGWYWAPRRTFRRLEMRVQWANRQAPKKGSHGRRRIDYIAHDPDDLRIHSQRLLTGHSDHRWPEVTYRVQED